MKNRVLLISLAVVLVVSISLISCAGGVGQQEEEEESDIPEYNLTISSTEGGEVTSPGEGTSTYDEGTVVDLVASPDAGYQFVSWTGDVGTIGNVDAAITAIIMNDDYSITAEFATPENIWLSGLITDLQNDATDTNDYTAEVYEDEHFARDLEDNLEGLGYDVTYLVVFEFDGTLLWLPLLEVRYSEDFAVLVDPRTDDVVTESYDGDGDGSTETLVNMDLTDISSWFDSLLATMLGNDGQYLIFGFGDYDTVRLTDTAVGKNITDLRRDLAANGVSESLWTPILYDCDDFARDLEDDLEQLGYRVTIKCVYRWEWGIWTGHAVVNVHCSDGTHTVEPQTDDIVTDVYDGDGDGVVESAAPGRVEAQVWLKGFKRGVPGFLATDGPYVIFEYEDSALIPFPVD